MTPEKAKEVLADIEMALGWKIITVTRDDVATAWYSEVDDAVITDQQWNAIRATDVWADFDNDEVIQDFVHYRIEEAIQDAEAALLEVEA